jgi:hypothetical protein
VLWGGPHTPAAADVDELLHRYAVQAELRARRRERQDAEAAATGKRQPALVPGDYDMELDAVREVEVAAREGGDADEDGASAAAREGSAVAGEPRLSQLGDRAVVDAHEAGTTDDDDDEAAGEAARADAAAAAAAAGVLNNLLRRKFLRQTYDKKVAARGAADAARHARGAGVAGSGAGGGRIGDFGFGSLDARELAGGAATAGANAAAPSSALQGASVGGPGGHGRRTCTSATYLRRQPH